MNNISVFVFFQNVICGYKLGYSLSCQEVKYSYDPYEYRVIMFVCWFVCLFKGCRMGRSDKASLWYVTLLINTRFRFFILE